MPLIKTIMPVKINEVEFIPHPHINYKYNYVKLAVDLARMQPEQQFATIREVILNDLWFIIYFIMNIKVANDKKGFVVEKCRMVEDDFKDGKRNYTPMMDIWGRYHFKSTIITVCETAQYHLKYPNECTCIFSYKKGAAIKFLDSIKKLYEDDLMKACFPDRLYETPDPKVHSWSLENGITIKRKNRTRKEKTIESSGLIEAMVTGSHYERMVFDDVETKDMAYNKDQLDKCYEMFDMADNLCTGADDDIVRVVGTYYSHCGPLVRIRDMLDANGKNVYKARIIPSEDENGEPVLVSKEKLAQLKTKAHYNSQHLCNPTPREFSIFKKEMVKEIDHDDIPERLFKFMLVDYAGDNETDDVNKDAWAIGVFGVEPKIDESGLYNIYLTDLVLKPMRLTVACDEIVRMYTRNGLIRRLGIERIHNSALSLHISNSLHKCGKDVSKERNNLIDLKPKSRDKRKRIIDALEIPLNSGKFHISNRVNPEYKIRLFKELDNFPYWHDDGLDIMSYLYDVIEDYNLKYRIINEQPEKKKSSGNLSLVNNKNAWMAA